MAKPSAPPQGSSIGAIARWGRAVAAYNAALTMQRDDLFVDLKLKSPNFEGQPETKSISNAQAAIQRLNAQFYEPPHIAAALNTIGHPLLTETIKESMYLARPVLVAAMIDRFRDAKQRTLYVKGLVAAPTPPTENAPVAQRRAYNKSVQVLQISLEPFVRVLRELAAEWNVTHFVWIFPGVGPGVGPAVAPEAGRPIRTAADVSLEWDEFFQIFFRLSSLQALVGVVGMGVSNRTSFSAWPLQPLSMFSVNAPVSNTVVLQQLRKLPQELAQPDWYAMIGALYLETGFLRVFRLHQPSLLLSITRRIVRQAIVRTEGRDTQLETHWAIFVDIVTPQGEKKIGIDFLFDISHTVLSVWEAKTALQNFLLSFEFSTLPRYIRSPIISEPSWIPNVDDLARLRQAEPLAGTTFAERLRRSGLYSAGTASYGENYIVGFSWFSAALNPYSVWNSYTQYRLNDRVTIQNILYVAGAGTRKGDPKTGWDVDRSSDREQPREVFPLFYVARDVDRVLQQLSADAENANDSFVEAQERLDELKEDFKAADSAYVQSLGGAPNTQDANVGVRASDLLTQVSDARQEVQRLQEVKKQADKKLLDQNQAGGHSSIQLDLLQPLPSPIASYRCVNIKIESWTTPIEPPHINESAEAKAAAEVVDSKRSSGLRGYIETIAGDGGCGRLVIANIPAGPILVNVAKRLNSVFDVDYASLLDAALKACNSYDGTQTIFDKGIRLRIPLLWKTGGPFYSRYGFLDEDTSTAQFIIDLGALPWFVFRDAYRAACVMRDQQTLYDVLHTVNALINTLCEQKICSPQPGHPQMATSRCDPRTLLVRDALPSVSVVACSAYATLVTALTGFPFFKTFLIEIGKRLPRPYRALWEQKYVNHPEMQRTEPPSYRTDDVATFLTEVENETIPALAASLLSMEYARWNRRYTPADAAHIADTGDTATSAAVLPIPVGGAVLARAF